MEYSVRNETTEKVSDVAVFMSSGHSFRHGVIPPGAHKGFGGSFSGSAKVDTLVIWRTDSGQIYTNRMVLTSAELKDRRWIQLKIQPDMSVTKGWRRE